MNEEPDRRVTLFLDANVIISASWKADAEVALIWKMPGIRLITSSYSMGEVQRNLPQIHQIERLRSLMRSVQVLHFKQLPNLPECQLLPEKDRPIFAAAVQAEADHLISGDKKHFGSWFGKTICGVRITPPTELLAALRRDFP
jgi:predicted nucleic acid-binding protein